MYTIDYFYNKFLDSVDKEGSDIYSVPQMMELLQSETYNFIEQTVKYLENTQQIRDLLRPLYKPYTINLIANPTDPKEMLAILPSYYLNLETAKVIGTNVRKTTILRHGEYDINELNPNKRATEEYPVVLLYQDYISVRGNTNTWQVSGFYVSKPVFGDPYGILTNEILVNLPENTVEKILLLMDTSYQNRNADQRFQSSFMQEQSFGQANK